jgi:hypothetical protein
LGKTRKLKVASEKKQTKSRAISHHICISYCKIINNLLQTRLIKKSFSIEIKAELLHLSMVINPITVLGYGRLKPNRMWFVA